MDVVIKLAKRSDRSHFFPFEPETVTFFNDNDDIHEIEAVDADFFPGCLRSYKLCLDLEFINQKPVDFAYQFGFIHERYYKLEK